MWGEIERQSIPPTDVEYIVLYLNDPQVTAEENIRYDVCLSVCGPVEPNGNMEVKEIPAGRHAKFTYIGEYDKLPTVYDKIYGELLAESGSLIPLCVYKEAQETTPVIHKQK